MRQLEISTPCNICDDSTVFWFDDGYVFSRIESPDGEWCGNLHDLEHIIELRDWLTEAINELEISK